MHKLSFQVILTKDGLEGYAAGRSLHNWDFGVIVSSVDDTSPELEVYPRTDLGMTICSTEGTLPASSSLINAALDTLAEEETRLRAQLQTQLDHIANRRANLLALTYSGGSPFPVTSSEESL